MSGRQFQGGIGGSGGGGSSQPNKELSFKELISCNIKRLTRPQFNSKFAKFNDPLAFGTDNNDLLSEKTTTKDTNEHIDNASDS